MQIYSPGDGCQLIGLRNDYFNIEDPDQSDFTFYDNIIHKNEGQFIFNDTHITFYLHIYGIRYSDTRI